MMDKITIQVHETDQAGKYDTFVLVPTAFGTHVQTTIAVGLDVKMTDVVIGAVENAYKALGIDASEGV
ncbi:hypothetical protein KDA23_00980 [Candidatus Saccharibacteria bacterium]|nr:hypothetical protein [Candidatus Saccharibacteria bacterium]